MKKIVALFVFSLVVESSQGAAYSCNYYKNLAQPVSNDIITFELNSDDASRKSFQTDISQQLSLACSFVNSYSTVKNQNFLSCWTGNEKSSFSGAILDGDNILSIVSKNNSVLSAIVCVKKQ